MRLYEMQSCSPHLYLMAVLIVAIKIWYRLDGAATAAADGMPASPDWITWAQSALHRLQGPMFPAADEEVRMSRSSVLERNVIVTVTTQIVVLTPAT